MTDIVHTRDYRDARKKEYPPVEVQLDALMKGFAALQALGVKLDPDAAAVVNKVMDVKAKFPKPTKVPPKT
jgi:hypothetical protein